MSMDESLYAIAEKVKDISRIFFWEGEGVFKLGSIQESSKVCVCGGWGAQPPYEIML